MLAALIERATRHHPDDPDPATRARAAFDVLGPLTVRAAFAAGDDDRALVPQYLNMAVRHLGGD